jgi:DHA1 family multidrug resistance protein-like MFS transporter
MTIVIPIFPVLQESEVRTGMLFSAKAAVQIFSAPLVATAVDDLGLRPLMLGLAIEVATTLVFALTQDYTIWFGARACQGFASACILSSGFLHVQLAYADDPPALGAAMGTVTTGIISGVVLGPPIGGILYGLSTVLPFLLLASLLVVVLVMTAVLSCRMRSTATAPVDDGLHPASPGKRGSTRSKAIKLLSDPRITVVLGALFAANAAISCLEATIGMYATRSLGLDISDVGFLFMVTAIPSVIGAKLAGTLGALAEGKKRWRVAFCGMMLQGGFFAAQAAAFPGVSVVLIEVRQFPHFHTTHYGSIATIGWRKQHSQTS